MRCMDSTRTWIYLSRDQRRRIDARARRERKTMAEVVREAVDQYLNAETTSVDVALLATFGSLPDLEVPSRAEWDRGRG